MNTCSVHPMPAGMGRDTVPPFYQVVSLVGVLPPAGLTIWPGVTLDYLRRQFASSKKFSIIPKVRKDPLDLYLVLVNIYNTQIFLNCQGSQISKIYFESFPVLNSWGLYTLTISPVQFPFLFSSCISYASFIHLYHPLSHPDFSPPHFPILPSQKFPLLSPFLLVHILLYSFDFSCWEKKEK